MSVITSLYLIIPAVFILLLAFPIFIELRVSVNPLYNRGVVALFIFGFKVFYFVVSIHGKSIILRNEKETKTEEIEFSSPQVLLIEEFMRQIREKIRLKKVYVFYNIGTGDAFTSAILCGLFNQILMHFFTIVKDKKPIASFTVFDTVSYNLQQFEVAGKISLSICLFDFIYSFLIALIATKQKSNNQKTEEKTNIK